MAFDPMGTMVIDEPDAEKLARALHADQHARDQQGPWEDLPEKARNIYREWARRVLKHYTEF
ncbi:MAG: hypothetical protein GWN53_17035 [Gammaproteobacteria bacterium]|uniref:Uncharacterized protein n=1 Tax=Candidatus Kutchimonas denitrificans TaxID=3056748 RepID=A0AAE4ZCA0_9BACT|nr:hypothetical protein [Candidatus Kutchimonas denitrificans]NIV53546.1 hypothetical protein [Gammaproteobacteria bacterium]